MQRSDKTAKTAGDSAGTHMTGGELYARLLRHVVPYWRVFALAIFAMIVTAATEPLFPALLKPLLDGSFVKKDPTTMKLVPLAVIGIFLVRGIFGFISDYTMSWVANKLIMDLRNLMFDRLLGLPTRYYNNHPSGTLIANIAFTVNQVADAGTSAITVLVKDLVTVIGLLGWMFYLNWRLSLVALIVVPMIVIIVKAFSNRLRQSSRNSQQTMGLITHVLEESLDGHKVVKVFGGQAYERERFFKASNALRQFNMKQTVAAAANVPLVQLVAAFALATIIYIATMQSAQDQTTVGGFVSFITAMLMLLSPLKRLTGVNQSLQRGLAAAEVVFGLYDEKAEKDEGKVALGRVSGKIEFDKVSFRYNEEGAAALDAISLTVAPGQTVALVGASGGGKTTLVNMLPRFYDPTEGVIRLDGHDITAVTLASLRQQIAMVSQDVVLFNDTIAANIAYGQKNQASFEQIVAAAKAANALEFIEKMPNGFDTLVGENGVLLSGGQRQRLAIARALLKDAPVLILDEATSALDTQSERQVQAALENLMQNRTTLVIAHRLSTVENADRILVLAHGKIAESGSHAELLAQGGIYAGLYRMQFAEASQS